MVHFYIGLSEPCHAQHFDRCLLSIGRLRRRKSDFAVSAWLMDSAAFTTITRLGHYPDPPETYAAEIDRWSRCGTLLAAVAQDYMCEPFALAKTGLTIADHQRLTIERYRALRTATRTTIVPVLQGFTPNDYRDHLTQYGDDLPPGTWTGVGSVCKRNGDPTAIYHVLRAIKELRPDLRLHGFGIKLTALSDPRVRPLLYSADSIAWSFNARKHDRNSFDWKEAETYRQRVLTQTTRHGQPPLI